MAMEINNNNNFVYDPVLLGNRQRRQIYSRRRTTGGRIEGTVSSFDATIQQQQQQLNTNTTTIGGNKRRGEVSSSTSSSIISVGDLVGESKMTAPELFSYGKSFITGTSEEALRANRALRSASLAQEKLLFATGASDGIACCQVQQRTKQNILRKEIRHVMNKISSPFQKKLKFHRSQGRLA
eukprot:CAMPEP_0194140632 /NCGR_PEP_ID=MMETSP0152-20130528/10165_1 /TAXON_ID=1049557 /ORGANISM="Thalassiothrix antarctica, Strain L6-D1" /LENGTH=181 /DNA_ID=CAMNT_0038838963 /DNA_START=299 /DNA_END=844 /DNA_ORIENTATION=-